MKSEAEAWREFAEFVSERVANGQTRAFLCNYLSNPRGAAYHQEMDYAPVKNWPQEKMLQRIRQHVVLSSLDDGRTLVDDRGDNSARVIFCLLMAHECEEDSINAE